MNLDNYNRNTDADWEHIAKSNPYYGVLTNERFLGMHLDNKVKTDFFESGRIQIANIAKLWDDFNGRKLNAALDFGSGVGRLVIPMAAYAEQAVGIEISDSMITELNKNLKQFDISNVQTFKTIDDLLLSKSVKIFDWINSFIVFQHIPPSKGYMILEQLLKILKVGGYLSLHFSIFKTTLSRGEEVYQQTDFNTLTALYAGHSETLGEMQMYDYDVNKIYYLLLKYGVGDFQCISENHGNHHTLRFVGCRKRFTLLPPLSKHSFLKGVEEWAQAIVEIKGFSYNESWGTWTESSEALISLYLLDELCGKDLVMDLALRAFLDNEGIQTFSVYANDVLIAEHTTRDWSATEYNVCIPSAITGMNNYITLKFLISNPTSPNQLGLSKDIRTLGIGLLRLFIKASG